MNIHGFETVDSLPCLYQPDTEILVVSDLHLGLEGTMTSDGNYVPRHQLKGIKEDIEEARDLTEASRILINGDMKNEFKTRYSETREIEELLKFLENLFKEVIVVKGNHDTFLESTLKKFGIELKDHHLENRTLFIHGDREIEEPETDDFDEIVIGHEHPALILEDDIGVREKIPCFLYGKTAEDERITVLPAFSNISKGTGINEVPENQLLSPVIKNRTDKDNLKAVGVSREAGLFKFPKLKKI